MRYGLAVAIFAALLAITLLLRVNEIRLNLTIIIGAGLVAASWFGGRGPGLLLVGLILGATIVLTPVSPQASLPMVVFAYFSVAALLVFLALLVSGRKNVEKKLREQHALLEDALARAQAAREEAEAANRSKDEFLATISHELRTPLNAILGWSAMLQEGEPDRNSLKNGLSVIERNAKSQDKLIGDILDVSRIITGKFRVDPRPVAMVPVIRSTMDTLFPTANAKDITISLTEGDGTPYITGDPELLQQIFWNLLSNAIKFTPPGGEVEISVTETESSVAVHFRDTGAGIDPAFLPYVFERFRQVDSSIKRLHGGLGLGLAIVRHLVELHGGTVSVESEGEGEGSIFTAEFPASREEPAAEEPIADTTTGVPHLNGLRVLVVDDHADTLEMFCMLLEQHGAATRAAGSCAAALEIIELWKPEVLVSDLGMPGEDGFDLIAKVRARGPQNGGDIPAAAITAYAREIDRDEALAAGFQAHVAKPVDGPALVYAVAGLAGRRSNIN